MAREQLLAVPAKDREALKVKRGQATFREK